MSTITRVVFPEIEPKIEILRLDEAPFEVECRELRWWFIVPEPNRRRRWATYDYPQRQLTAIEEMEVTGKTRVHGEECYEMRYHAFAPDGALQREAFAYGAIRRGMARWYGWWNLGDENKIYTWRDPGFEERDWAGCPVRIVDAGRYRWLDENHLTDQEPRKVDPPLPADPIGAGVWLLRVGEAEHRCLRLIEVVEPPTPSYEYDTWKLAEGFLNAEGKVLLFRRYNAPHLPLQGGNWQETLKDSLTLTHNGNTYYLWYDCLTEEGLSPSGLTR